jgi:MYXO-CTERM domain-containing protein
MSRRLGSFGWKLAAITAAGLVVRLLYALVVMRDVAASGDGLQFHLLGQVLERSHEYIQPFPFLRHGSSIPTAEKPPLYPAYLALSTLLGASSYAAHRAASCLLGAATVAVVGLLGRRVDGERTGLVAAAIAAVYPMLVMLDGSGRSESLYVLLVALSLLAAYRLADRPGWPSALLLGALIGLAALTRSEAIFLLPLLVLPAAWRAAPATGRRLALVALACLGLVVVTGPYELRNLNTFHRTVLLSTNEGGLLAGANCDAGYYGVSIGSWPCYTGIPATHKRDESDISWRLRRRALDYAGDHAGRVPAVMAVRVLRTWELWDVRDQALVEERISERNLHAQQAGVVALWVLALLAVAGAVALRRRREPLLLLMAPIVMVTVVSALTWGTSRFRAAADVPVVVLAAVGVSWLAAARAARRAA